MAIILLIVCICDRIATNTPTSSCTSLSSFPLPLAIRRLRAGCLASKSGVSRSSFVIELIIASYALYCRSTAASCLSVIPPIPGIILAICPRLPMLVTVLYCCKKSLKSNLAAIIFFVISIASSSLIAASAFSTSVTTSPNPRIRLAIRSGMNASRSCIFSPVPTNLIGFPLTSFTDSAAPPRVSPSVLVSIAPVIPAASSNDFTSPAASCPVIASTTSSTSDGLTTSFISRSSCIIPSSIFSRPAVSISTTSYPSAFAFATPSAAIFGGGVSVPISNTGTPTVPPTVLS